MFTEARQNCEKYRWHGKQLTWELYKCLDYCIKSVFPFGLCKAGPIGFGVPNAVESDFLLDFDGLSWDGISSRPGLESLSIKYADINPYYGCSLFWNRQTLKNNREVFAQFYHCTAAGGKKKRKQKYRMPLGLDKVRSWPKRNLNESSID